MTFLCRLWPLFSISYHVPEQDFDAEVQAGGCRWEAKHPHGQGQQLQADGVCLVRLHSAPVGRGFMNVSGWYIVLTSPCRGK